MTRHARWRAALRSPVVKLGLSAVLLAALFTVTDIRTLRAALATADWRWLVVAMGLNLTSQVASSGRWWLLTRAVGFTASFGRVVTCYFSGMYLHLFGPGTVAGDVGRALFLAAGHRRALALTTVVAHRAIGLVALVWICALGVLLSRALPLPPGVRWLAALAVPATLLAWLAGPRVAVRLLPLTHHWRLLIERDLAPFWRDRRLLVVSLALALVVHVLQISAQATVARALGLAVPWAYFWVLVPLLNVGSTLPLSWSGIGLREAAYWYALSQLGVSEGASVAVGLLCSVMILLTGLTGLPFFVLLRWERTR